MSAVTVPERLIFDVTGMDCADCARSVERVVGVLPNVSEASVSFGTGTLSVTPEDGGTSRDEIARAVGGAVDRAGYVASLRIDGEMRLLPQLPWWKNRKVVPTAIAAVLWGVAFTLLHVYGLSDVSTAVFLTAIVIGGYPIARSAWTAILARRLDMNVLMSISVIGAAALGDWSEGALVVVLFSVGTTLQAITFERTRGAIRGLLDKAPEEAVVVRNDVDVTVAARELVAGDEVRVRPGERLPADGTVLQGHSAVQQAAITGESMPVGKGAGDSVFAGTMNGTGMLLVRVDKPVSQSMLANIVHLVEEAQSAKAPSQQLVDRFAAIYTPTVVLIAGAIALSGWAFSVDPGTWVYRALVLLVIACPCALVISTPVSIVSAIGAATRMGILVKGGAALEDMARVKTVAFDKTGTLTMGRPSVTAVLPYGGMDEAGLLATAAAVEGPSEHPLSRAIVARALHDDLRVEPAEAFESYPGRGVSAEVGGRRVAIGNERMLSELGVFGEQIAWVNEQAESFGVRGEPALPVVELRDGTDPRVLGVIVVADRMRRETVESVASLRDAGIQRLAMLSGDRNAVARSVADTAGIDTVMAELLPDEKSAAIATLQANGPVAMVGDGVNDAPALAVADVGVAMGMGGTDVALESADVVLMRDDLGSLSSLVTLSKRTLTVIRQNVTVSMVTKVLALVLGAFGFVNLWIAVLFDVGTSLLVTANGLRLARVDAAAPTVEDQPAACGCGEDHDHQDGHDHDHATAAD
jgi:Cd2+/Zn2+-exporting ATPase